MALSGDTTVKEPSEGLGTKDSTLRRWAQEYESTGDGAFPGNGSPRVNKDHEIVRLGKRIGELGRESELLRNLRAFLSQDRV